MLLGSLGSLVLLAMLLVMPLMLVAMLVMLVVVVVPLCKALGIPLRHRAPLQPSWLPFVPLDPL